MTALQYAIYDVLNALLADNGWEVSGTGVQPDGVAVIRARSTRGDRPRQFYGSTVAEASALMMMELTGLRPEQRSDRLDANRVARQRLARAIWKLLPAEEDEL